VSFIMKKETARSSEMLESYHINTQCHNPEDNDLRQTTPSVWSFFLPYWLPLAFLSVSFLLLQQLSEEVLRSKQLTSIHNFIFMVFCSLGTESACEIFSSTSVTLCVFLNYTLNIIISLITIIIYSSNMRSTIFDFTVTVGVQT